MKYLEARDQIKSGDIIALSRGGWGNFHDILVNCVRIFTKSTYSHVGIAWVIGGRVFIVDAVVPKIRIFPLSKEVPFYWLPTPFKWNDTVEEKLLERVGEPYSRIEAIRAFISKNTNGERVWECAKLVNRTMMVFDPGFDDINDTPACTVEYLQSKHNCPLIYVDG